MPQFVILTSFPQPISTNNGKFTNICVNIKVLLSSLAGSTDMSIFRGILLILENFPPVEGSVHSFKCDTVS